MACTQASAPSPVAASTRRTPAATPPWDVILKKPMSPVRATCVPPHSSRDEPMSRTRTSSPYFSPNKRSEEHTSELQSLRHPVCRLLLEKKKQKITRNLTTFDRQTVAMSAISL